MKTRTLGRTGLSVSEIGFGAWGIGAAQWIGAEDQRSLRALKAARQAGINFFDTALAYGDGHSEQLIRQAFGSDREIVVASKIPPRDLVWPARRGAPLAGVFPKRHVLSSLDRSLRNLGREQIDLEQFHVWNDDWAAEAEWIETVEEMKRSGKARFVGISINDHQPTNCLKALATGLIDAVQVIFNLFDQSPQDELFPYCREHNIGVIARVPFDEGSLTGNVRPGTEFAAGDFRNQYFQGERRAEVWRRVQAIAREASIAVEEMPSLALRFVLSALEVATVIPGMRDERHVAGNVAASDAGPLPPGMLRQLAQHRWVRNFYSP
ncbi:MAG: aldo/keto reductase [Acidobacteria bacterium]|nr:aldo/keto reductase [Acidobacteriota bacterium]